MGTLLAIDLGLRTGLALYGPDGKLRSYRSHNFGSPARLKKGAWSVLSDPNDLEVVVIEGGGDLAEIWLRVVEKRNLRALLINAETWREKLLYAREQRSGAEAKQHADELARRVIEWSNATRPTSLRHDAAEAILVGLWGVLEIGWLVPKWNPASAFGEDMLYYGSIEGHQRGRQCRHHTIAVLGVSAAMRKRIWSACLQRRGSYLPNAAQNMCVWKMLRVRLVLA
jgi:hypothetical protein